MSTPKQFVIRNVSAKGKNKLNCGDYYGSTGDNGMWKYHRWVNQDQAKTFPDRVKAQAFKDAWAKSISPIYGRVVLQQE